MVVLMLDHAGIDALKRLDMLFKVFIEVLEGQIGRTLHIATNVGDTETTLFVLPRLSCFVHLFGVDEYPFDALELGLIILPLVRCL